MKVLFISLFLFCIPFLKASAQPANPSPCTAVGNNTQNNLSIVSQTSTVFTLNTLNSFETVQVYANNIRFKVVSRSSRYRLYIAGQLTSPAGVITTIPLNNFTVEPVLVSSNSPSLITLSNVNLSAAYLQLAQRTNAGNAAGDVYDFTVKLSGMGTFTQAPGNYTLTFHFQLCHY